MKAWSWRHWDIKRWRLEVEDIGTSGDEGLKLKTLGHQGVKAWSWRKSMLASGMKAWSWRKSMLTSGGEGLKLKKIYVGIRDEGLKLKKIYAAEPCLYSLSHFFFLVHKLFFCIANTAKVQTALVNITTPHSMHNLAKALSVSSTLLFSTHRDSGCCTRISFCQEGHGGVLHSLSCCAFCRTWWWTSLRVMLCFLQDMVVYYTPCHAVLSAGHGGGPHSVSCCAFCRTWW